MTPPRAAAAAERRLQRDPMLSFVVMSTSFALIGKECVGEKSRNFFGGFYDKKNAFLSRVCVNVNE